MRCSAISRARTGERRATERGCKLSEMESADGRGERIANNAPRWWVDAEGDFGCIYGCDGDSRAG